MRINYFVLFRWLAVSLVLVLFPVDYANAQSTALQQEVSTTSHHHPDLAPTPLPTNRVILLIAPDGQGGSVTYTGEEAQAVYSSHHPIDAEYLETLPVESDEYQPFETELADDVLADALPVKKPKYRFVNVRRGITWGKPKRITPYVSNLSSGEATHTLSGTVSAATTHSVSLSGGYRAAFVGTVGAEWEKTKSGSITISHTIPPGRQAWIEFRPELRTVDGRLEKYSRKKVLESKQIHSTSARWMNATIGGSSHRLPSGEYIIRDRAR